jgi:hypothetical protein
MSDSTNPITQVKEGDVAYLKVTYGRPTAFADQEGRRLVQVTVFQPFAPDLVVLVRDDSIVTAPPGTKIDFSTD